MWCMKYVCIPAIILTLSLLVPAIAQAQVIGDSLYGLNSVLDKLFKEMMPLCQRMIDVGRAIGGFAALSFISVRAWRHFARAEAIDFFVLLKPFAVGLAILFFPVLIQVMDSVLEPTVKATKQMSKDSNKAILRGIEEEIKANMGNQHIDGLGGDKDLDQYGQGNDQKGNGSLSGVFAAFSFKNVFKLMLRDFFAMLHAAVSLGINAISTFIRIVLVILGPLVFGLSIFEGFQQSLTSWFTRYINVYLWLPVANIFGAITAEIQENLFSLDQDAYSSIAYIIFLMIATLGYFTVPTVAGYIVQAGGRDGFLHKVNQVVSKGVAAAKVAAGAL